MIVLDDKALTRRPCGLTHFKGNGNNLAYVII